jgi:hypothetical protein
MAFFSWNKRHPASLARLREPGGVKKDGRSMNKPRWV